MKKIEIAQLWKLVNPEKYYNTGTKGDIFIILSGESPLVGAEVWKIGCFWWSRRPLAGMKGWGGAREKNFTEYEINEIGEYIGYLPDLIK